MEFYHLIFFLQNKQTYDHTTMNRVFYFQLIHWFAQYHHFVLFFSSFFKHEILKMYFSFGFSRLYPSVAFYACFGILSLAKYAHTSTTNVRYERSKVVFSRLIFHLFGYVHVAVEHNLLSSADDE